MEHPQQLALSFSQNIIDRNPALLKGPPEHKQDSFRAPTSQVRTNESYPLLNLHLAAIKGQCETSEAASALSSGSSSDAALGD
jgi:hypothetical protein